ncbi:MAG: hypothetical protein ACRCU6_02075, partial [Fusobacteriaceae bacterium]
DGIIIIGPMDDANPKASDTLLKIIEDEPSSCRLNLWAHDIGEVSKTIKSRCIPVWCQFSFTGNDGEDLSESVSRSYIQALLAGRYYELHDILSQYKEKDMSLLSHSIADALWADAANPKALRIWNRIRPLMGKSHTSKLELISVCL